MCDELCPCKAKTAKEPEGCEHIFPIWVYIPLGQTIYVTCPYCQKLRKVVGTGPIWTGETGTWTVSYQSGQCH